MNSNYFIFNENKCVGCEACVVACVLENGIQFPDSWRSIFKFNKDKIPGIPLFNLSLACNHCEDAPCMEGCPAIAYSMDSQTGAILIDSELCIGCRYCTWNCPYEAPKYNPVSGVIEKCNFCNSRLLENKKPSCAVSCPTGALDFSFDEIDKRNISSTIEVPNKPSPSIVIHELTSKNGPEIDDKLFVHTDFEQSLPADAITAKKELPLLIFTFIISCMTAVSASNILSGFQVRIKLAFLLIGALAAVISVLHLGKKGRFWRSILNIRRSWLSREIFFFSVYYLLSIIDLLIFRIPQSVLVISGLLTLLSIDMLYKPLQWEWKFEWHSGQVLIIAISLFMLIAQFYFVLSIFFLVRLVVMLFQFPGRKIITVIRFAFPFMGFLLLNVNIPMIFCITVFLLGEFIDRVLFYNDLLDFKVVDSIKPIQHVNNN